ncbi:TPA: hypothetical protein ACG04C_004535 [Escherichia coli]
MINSEAIEQLMWLWSLFDIKFLSILAAAFTIYFGVQKISKKVTVSYSANASRIYDMHISTIILNNKRDNAIAISSINMEVEGKGILQVIKFDSPLLLKNYDSLKVEPPKFSSLYNNDGVVKLDISDKFHFYIITTSGDEIKCISENKYVAPNMENKIATDIRKFNGIILTNRMSYIFFYANDNGEKYCIIDVSLFINGDNPFHFNFLKEDELRDFSSILISYGYHQQFKSYALFKIDNHLAPSLVLNKSMIENNIIEMNK